MADGHAATRRLLHRASRVARGSLIAAGALSITGLLAISAAVKNKQKAMTLPDNFVLVMDLDGTEMTEASGTDLFTQLQLNETQLQLSKVTNALHCAGTDSRVLGLVSNIGNAQGLHGLAHVQELRNAILDFRKLKSDSVPSVAYSDTFDEFFTRGTLPYYLATAFDQIYVQQNGSVPFTGFSVMTPFLRIALDKWHVGFTSYSREEYKGAVQTFTDKQHSRANREAMQQLLHSYIGQIVDGVAAAQGLSPDEVYSALHSSPLSPHAAAAAGLITGSRYKADAMQTLLHSTHAVGDPVAAFAAKPASIIDAIVSTVRRQSSEGKAAKSGKAPVKADSIPDASGNKAEAEHSKANLGDSKVGMGHNAANSTAAEQASLSGSQAASVLARIQESNLAGPSNQRAALVTDKQETISITRTNMVSMRKYVQALDAEKRQKERKGGMQGLFQALSQMTHDDEEDDRAREGKKAKVAVITAAGQILAGKPKPSTTGAQTLYSDKLIQDLQQARRDAAVKAVVLRVDSPGGSAVASDSIWHEVRRLRQSGKPVIVSMGNYAASGGYYISAPATKIVAQPGTLTGSIGVAFGKFNFAQAFLDQGVNVESISVGHNADAQSPFRDYTKAQARLVNATVDETYWDFMGKVAEGRGLSLEQVHKIAKGRIWSGEDALQRGLVDKLGGLQDAVQIAKQEAGLSEDEDAVDVVPFPPPKPLWQQLQEALVEQPSTLGLSLLLPSLRIAEACGVAPAPDAALLVPWMWLAFRIRPDMVPMTAVAEAMQGPGGAQLLHRGPFCGLAASGCLPTTGVQLLCPPLVVC